MRGLAPFIALAGGLALASTVETRLEWLLDRPLVGLPTFDAPHPPTVATAKLGRLLFYDKRLSADRTISCASCHQVDHAYSLPFAVAQGIQGQKGTRKPPPILNKAFLAPQFWDGRANSLEEQALGPLFHPAEMGNTAAGVVTVIDGIEGYRPLFRDAFGDNQITIARITRALADFERTLLSGGALYDQWQANPKVVAYPLEAQRGFALFQDRDCAKCHIPPFFTDNLFHNTGVGFEKGAFKDLGRFAHTQSLGTAVDAERGAFKTPTLRNLLKRAPYMHDGSIADLASLVEFYNRGGIRNPFLDINIIPLGLQPSEKTDLMAFLITLEGTGFEETPPRPEEFPL